MTQYEAKIDQPAWENGPYSIKRHGTTLNNCDVEPIHTPGCIQAHGVLLVLRPTDLTILQISENAASWLGIPPEELLGQTVSVVLGAEGQSRLQEALANDALEHNPLHVFSFPEPRGLKSLDVSIHTEQGMAILEIEEAEERSGSADSDYYTLLKSTLTRLQNATSLFDFCSLVASEVRSLTNLDRVMVYRFHPDHHGEVYAESRRDDLPPWLGLHYPAEDIPKPARDIFKKIWIRPLPDAQAQPVELMPLLNPDTKRAPDLTYCALRGASIMYTEYLHNMGVSASLTMPILRDGELWGLIACHHYTPTHFSYRIRAACEFLAQAVSLQIKSIDDREQLLYRLKLDGIHGQLITSAVKGEYKLEALVEGYPNLLDGLEASGAALFHRGRWWVCGRTPDKPQLEALALWLEDRAELVSSSQPLYVTDELSRDYPDGHALIDTASGVLAISFSRKLRLMVLWFRTETPQTLHWAGSPHDKPSVMGPNGPRLTPRSSFELFVESVQGRSLPWKGVEIEAVLRLRLWVMELVIDRSERLAELNADLARSNHGLDAFAYVVSHDLKEPLRGIANHTRKLLEEEETLSEAQRQRMDSLAKLTQRMDTLLNSLLHFTRIGRVPLDIGPSNLNQVVEESLKMVGIHRLEAEVIMPRPLPTVACDRMRIREVFCCLLDNALRYNHREPRRVEIGYMTPAEAPPLPDAYTKSMTTYYVKDNGIGIEADYLSRIFDLFRRLHARDTYGAGAGAGLSIARFLIERHQGHLWAESVPGEGSSFYFTLSQEPVDVP